VENIGRMSLSPCFDWRKPWPEKGRKNPWQEIKKLLQSEPLSGDDEGVQISFFRNRLY
jgi:hypothetical protein